MGEKAKISGWLTRINKHASLSYQVDYSGTMLYVRMFPSSSNIYSTSQPSNVPLAYSSATNELNIPLKRIRESNFTISHVAINLPKSLQLIKQPKKTKYWLSAAAEATFPAANIVYYCLPWLTTFRGLTNQT